MAKLTDQDRKDLSKALSYANWSALGLLIPFVGWLLAGMALSFIKTVPKTSDSEARIKQVKRSAWVGIIISSIAVAVWGGLYRYQQINDGHLPIIENKVQESLKQCLSEADIKSATHVNKNRVLIQESNGVIYDRTPQDVHDKSNEIKEFEYNNCYKAYDAGISR